MRPGQALSLKTSIDCRRAYCMRPIRFPAISVNQGCGVCVVREGDELLQRVDRDLRRRLVYDVVQLGEELQPGELGVRPSVLLAVAGPVNAMVMPFVDGRTNPSIFWALGERGHRLVGHFAEWDWRLRGRLRLLHSITPKTYRTV
jgi:hypothetical protein